MRQTALLLVILSFLLGIIAPACGFMWDGKYSVIEICTTEGIEQRVVANADNPNKPSHDQAKNNCDFCFQNANLGNYLLSSEEIATRVYNVKTKHAFTHQRKISDSFSTTNLARGPPVLS